MMEALCGLPSCLEEATHQCSGCKARGYCSKEHYHDDWKAHKTDCRRICKARDAASGEGAAGGGAAAPATASGSSSSALSCDNTHINVTYVVPACNPASAGDEHLVLVLLWLPGGLDEINRGPRAVSQAWAAAGDVARTTLLSLVSRRHPAQIRVFGLASVEGRLLNGWLGSVVGDRKDAAGRRFPVELTHAVTGEVSRRSVKAANLCPIERIKGSDETVTVYTTVSAVRLAHGEALEAVLTNGRWLMNNIVGHIQGAGGGLPEYVLCRARVVQEEGREGEEGWCMFSWFSHTYSSIQQCL